MVSDLSSPSSNSPFEELWPLRIIVGYNLGVINSRHATRRYASSHRCGVGGWVTFTEQFMSRKSDLYAFALFVGNATRSNPIPHANHWQDHHPECTLEIVVVVVVVVDAGAVAVAAAAVDDDDDDDDDDDEKTESAWNISREAEIREKTFRDKSGTELDKGCLSARAAANNNDFNHDCITKLKRPSLIT
uniref:Uncharacterized protein n=1 Tax=Glossina austeni TaxID=7395 RepID=A0A1A9VCQ3_GLOAU